LAISLADPFLASKIPSALALEFSPYLMIGGSSLSLKSYQESALKRILYHTRVSLGTQRSGDTTFVAVGLRFTLLDESDLRLDNDYISKVFSLNDRALDITSRIRDHFRGPAPVYVALPKNQRDSIDRLVGDSIAVEAAATQMLDSSIAAERETAKLRNWNKPIVEVGLAFAGASSDSMHLSGIVGTKAALWLVGAGGIDDWGQWVIGLNATLYRKDSGKFSGVDGSLSSRLYAGENAYKGFIQFESQIADGDLQNLMQLGGELRLYGIIWADFSAGVQKTGSNKPTFTSNFNLRFGTP
jgi:hypothetical protein